MTLQSQTDGVKLSNVADTFRKKKPGGLGPGLTHSQAPCPGPFWAPHKWPFPLLYGDTNSDGKQEAACAPLSLLCARFRFNHAGMPCSMLASPGPGSSTQGFAWTGADGHPTQLWLLAISPARRRSASLGGQMSAPCPHRWLTSLKGGPTIAPHEHHPAGPPRQGPSGSGSGSGGGSRAGSGTPPDQAARFRDTRLGFPRVQFSAWLGTERSLPLHPGRGQGSPGLRGLRSPLPSQTNGLVHWTSHGAGRWEPRK